MGAASSDNFYVLEVITSQLRKKLIEARNEAQLSIEDLAEKCGVSADLIAAIEEGKKFAELMEFSKILDGCSYFDDENQMWKKELDS